MMLLENDQATWVSLDGEWRFSLAGGPDQLIPVPAAWEAHTADKVTDGPGLYQRTFVVSADQIQHGRLLLEFGAVSFWASVRVNSIQVGMHQGMWSPFQVDVTRWLHVGDNQLELEVWKPGRRFPVRETVAGFLPDVAAPFGGVWQGVRLRAPDAGFADLKVLCLPGSRLEVTGSVFGLDASRGADVTVDVAPSGGASSTGLAVQVAVDRQTGTFSAVLYLRGLPRWRPGAPALHTVTLSAWQAGVCQARAARQVGLREIAVRDGAVWLDERPLHLRGVLDWGWKPEQIRPASSPEALAQQIRQSRTLGFNLIKLCLFVPDETTFDAADQAGMFLWLEMPMWLPHLTPEVKTLVRQEYEAVFRRVYHHASIVAVSLGCELNAEADSEFLADLHALARQWFPNALLCDNSGSAEAYGGVTTALQDFYDYHFYTDPHNFRPLIDHFSRDYRPRKPWIFGEFCDADTGRDFGALVPQPWWMTDALALDRDDFIYQRDHATRLAAAGITDGGAALTRVARRQATAVRKYILEQARLHDATGGYVVSGWTDTPITTSGIVDDRGQPKFDGDEWRLFNGDGVLLIDRERRRRWMAGSDRPAFRDPFTWWTGETTELRVLLSNALGPIAGGRLHWEVVDAAGHELASADGIVAAMPAGQVTPMAELHWVMRAAGLAPMEMTLHANCSLALPNGSHQNVHNRWTLWSMPRPDLGDVLGVVGLDTLPARPDLAQLSAHTRLLEAHAAPADAPLLANEYSATLLEEVRQGRRAVLWVSHPDWRFTRRLPFWREAIHVFEPHELWSQIPQPGYADMRFFSVASDLALDLTGLQASFGPAAKIHPLWRRFDARTLTWADYLVEVQYGRGYLFVTSLRFDGGLGYQPEGLQANPQGAWMLAALLHAASHGEA